MFITTVKLDDVASGRPQVLRFFDLPLLVAHLFLQLLHRLPHLLQLLVFTRLPFHQLLLLLLQLLHVLLPDRSVPLQLLQLLLQLLHLKCQEVEGRGGGGVEEEVRRR